MSQQNQQQQQQHDQSPSAFKEQPQGRQYSQEVVDLYKEITGGANIYEPRIPALQARLRQLEEEEAREREEHQLRLEQYELELEEAERGLEESKKEFARFMESTQRLLVERLVPKGEIPEGEMRMWM